MTDSEFTELIETTLHHLEEALDTLTIDIDYETTAGVFTVQFPNRSKIIISRQTATHQLWIAAKSGGFHLDYDSHLNTWKTDESQGRESAGVTLPDLLSRLFTEHAGETVNFTQL